MKPIWSAFRQFLRAIWGDAMLAACLFGPVLMAAGLRYGIPALEGVLAPAVGTAHVLAPYYALFDLLLSLMTPLLLCFSGVMVVLEELDDGTARYLMVTPLRVAGYLCSRLLILTVLSIGYNVALLGVFSLSGMPLTTNVLAALCNAVLSVAVSMLVIGFAKNKVEGMALIKLSGFFMLGYLAAYFMDAPLAYAAGIFPGYWLALMVRDGAAAWAIPGAAVAMGWVLVFYRKFYRRVTA